MEAHCDAGQEYVSLGRRRADQKADEIAGTCECESTKWFGNFIHGSVGHAAFNLFSCSVAVRLFFMAASGMRVWNRDIYHKKRSFKRGEMNETAPADWN